MSAFEEKANVVEFDTCSVQEQNKRLDQNKTPKLNERHQLNL